MSLTKMLSVQVKNNIPVLAFSYVILLGLFFSVAIIGANYEIPIEKFTRDPTVILGGHPFVGVISNIGILLWCSTAAICLFTSVIKRNNKNTVASQFFMISGLFTLILLLDDLFMIHDEILPTYFHIPEEAVYLGYLVLISTYFIRFKNFIVKTEFIVLFLACAFFALSVVSDIFLPQEGLEFLVEDGFKLFGIATWFIFFIKTCSIQIQGIVDS